MLSERPKYIQRATALWAVAERHPRIAVGTTIAAFMGLLTIIGSHPNEGSAMPSFKVNTPRPYQNIPLDFEKVAMTPTLVATPTIGRQPAATPQK